MDNNSIGCFKSLESCLNCFVHRKIVEKSKNLFVKYYVQNENVFELFYAALSRLAIENSHVKTPLCFDSHMHLTSLKLTGPTEQLVEALPSAL